MISSNDVDSSRSVGLLDISREDNGDEDLNSRVKTSRPPSTAVHRPPVDEFTSSELESTAAVSRDFSLAGESPVDDWTPLPLSSAGSSKTLSSTGSSEKASVAAASLLLSSEFSNASDDRIVPRRKRRQRSSREDFADEVCCLQKALSVLLSTVQKKSIYFEDFELPGTEFGDKKSLSKVQSIVDSNCADELKEGKASVLCRPMSVASFDLSVDCLSSGNAEALNLGRCFTESFEIDQRNSLPEEVEKTLENSSSQMLNANDEFGRVNVTPFTHSFVASSESQEQQIDGR